MPTNNTPFTWNDAQWLNTQITNCVERSVQAIVTAEQAVGMVNSFSSGPRLLSKRTGVNLNPTITLTYTSPTGTFVAGDTITDTNGSTAVIVSFSSVGLILTNLVMVGEQSFSGTITGSVSGATATAGTTNWGDQSITLTGGNTFIITDIVLTNASAVPVYAHDAEWWSGISRTGINYANTVTYTVTLQGNGSGGLGGLGETTPLPFPLASADQYMSISNIEISYPSQSTGSSLSTCGTLLYLTLGTPEGSPLTCDMYIYGYVLN